MILMLHIFIAPHFMHHTRCLQAEAAAAESRAADDLARLRNANATLRAEAEQQQRHLLLQLQVTMSRLHCSAVQLMPMRRKANH
jgi:hypothetical protein